MIVAGAVLALGASASPRGRGQRASAVIFVDMGMDTQGANTLAAVIIGMIVAIIAWIFVKHGIDKLKAETYGSSGPRIRSRVTPTS